MNGRVEVHVLCFNVKKTTRVTYSWLLLRVGLSLQGNIRGKNEPVFVILNLIFHKTPFLSLANDTLVSFQGTDFVVEVVLRASVVCTCVCACACVPGR